MTTSLYLKDGEECILFKPAQLPLKCVAGMVSFSYAVALAGIHDAFDRNVAFAQGAMERISLGNRHSRVVFPAETRENSGETWTGVDEVDNCCSFKIALFPCL